MIEHHEYIHNRKDKPLVTNLCPGFYRQFRDLNGGVINNGHFSTVYVLVVQQLVNCASEAFVIWKLWEKANHKQINNSFILRLQLEFTKLQSNQSFPHHGQRLLSVQHAVDVVDDLSYVEVGDLAGPACADTVAAVHQHSGDDGHVPLWLHTLIVIIVVLKQVVIRRWEQKAGQRAGWKNS